MFYHPVPVRVTYGMHVDGLSVFGVQNPSLLLQIVSISFEDLAFRPQLQTTMAQRVQLAILAENLRKLSFSSFHWTIFKELAAGIPRANGGHQAGPSTVWPKLHTIDFRGRFNTTVGHSECQDATWITASAPALESIAIYSPHAAPEHVPNGLRSLVFSVRDQVSEHILQSSATAANLRVLALDDMHSTASYNQPSAFRSMSAVLLAAAPRLSNLRTLNVRGFGPKNSLADAVAVLVALPSLRTLRLLITGEGDVRRETALLTRILNAANIRLHTLGLICLTSPTQRRGPLPSFVLDVFGKARLPCLRTVLYAARREESGHVYPPIASRSNAQKLKALCILRRVKFEVVELESNQVWIRDELSRSHAVF